MKHNDQAKTSVQQKEAKLVAPHRPRTVIRSADHSIVDDIVPSLFRFLRPPVCPARFAIQSDM